MSGLSILRRLLAGAATPPANTSGLPPDELRFALEYRKPPDVAAETLALKELLAADVFVLEPLFRADDPDLARFLLLRFPGIERTLSPSVLFQIGYDLADARDLVAAEPDLGSRHYADPERPGLDPRVEGVDVLGPLCWVGTQPPADRRWALESMGVLRAWSRFASRGEGILIGQPDTGVAEHADLARGGLDLGLGTDIVDGDDDASDPLDGGAANPGHGTGTASVVISRDGGTMIGSAPAATLVPIRCITDVKIFNGTPVARAIEHAVSKNCDVITMSLGGLPSLSVRAAVRAAVARGVIVVAAAGNCVHIVVYPARYDDVIAVAGVNAADQPWKGSSHGRAVDISAPAELVWRADRRAQSDPTDVVSGGQGTSFATALTAGVAALWLAHHGRDKVREEARRRGVTVQRLFKAALQSTARVPSAWDDDEFGPGIVDADQLLGLALGSIRTAGVEAVASQEDVSRVLDDAAGPKPKDSSFDWNRYGLEVANIVYENARVGRDISSPFETLAPGTKPSPELVLQAAKSTDPRLNRLTSRAVPQSPYLVRSRTGNFVPPPSIVRILGRPRGEGLESAGSISAEKALENLKQGGARQVLDEAGKRLEAIAGPDADPELARLHRTLLGDGEKVLDRIAKGSAVRSGGYERATLEALVSLTDRPAIRVENGTIDQNHPELGPWQGAYALTRDEIEKAFRSVGRIDAGGGHVGTGFVVGPGLVMTNRHVIEAFAAPAPKRRNPSEWILEGDDVTIDFSDDASGGATVFRVKSVVSAGGEPIEDLPIDFGKLDMALLEVETSNGADTLPPPIPVYPTDARARKPIRLFTVGYPAKPQVLPTDDTGKLRMDVVDRLRAIFRHEYGVKYFSPGMISSPLGAVEESPQDWVFSHDATTLAGNSGSAVIDFDNAVGVVGLHFAGDWLRANHAHSVGKVKASGAIKLDRVDWV